MVTEEEKREYFRRWVEKRNEYEKLANEVDFYEVSRDTEKGRKLRELAKECLALLLKSGGLVK